MSEVVENGSLELQQEANALMGKIMLKLGSLKLEEQGCQEEEEEKGQEGFQALRYYQQSFYQQAVKFIRQAAQQAFHLNKLSEMRECYYLMAMIYNMIPYSGT